MDARRVSSLKFMKKVGKSDPWTVELEQRRRITNKVFNQGTAKGSLIPLISLVLPCGFLSEVLFLLQTERDQEMVSRVNFNRSLSANWAENEKAARHSWI